MNVLLNTQCQAFTLALAIGGMPLASRALEPGEQAPDISGRSVLNEHRYRLSDFRGKVVIVDFWASWCGPCVLSMPELDALRQRLLKESPETRFEILGVNLDEDSEKAIRFLQSHPVSYPVIVDLLGLGSRAYAPRKLPSAYVVDVTGKVRFIYYGYAKGYGNDVENIVREQLKQVAK